MLWWQHISCDVTNTNINTWDWSGILMVCCMTMYSAVRVWRVGLRVCLWTVCWCWLKIFFFFNCQAAVGCASLFSVLLVNPELRKVMQIANASLTKSLSKKLKCSIKRGKPQASLVLSVNEMATFWNQLAGFGHCQQLIDILSTTW